LKSVNHNRQQGAALLAALLVVTLATALVSGLLWREEVRIRTLENQRLRDSAQWLGVGALDWARLMLREDLYQTGNVDQLGEVWAIPINETPLSDFMQTQGATMSEADRETWLSGAVVDANSHFNLTSLIEVANPQGDAGWVSATRVNPEAIAIFARLLQSVGLNPEGAGQVAQALLLQRQPIGAEGDNRLPVTCAADLLGIIPGATPDQLAVLGQYTVVLPRPSAVNANTASVMVLAAALGVTLSQAQQLVADRTQSYFPDYGSLTSRIRSRAPQWITVSNRNLSVSTEYFWVVERLRHGRLMLTQQALISRRAGPGNATRVLWIKPGLPDGVSVGG
jgi:general secretion pathway protein K